MKQETKTKQVSTPIVKKLAAPAQRALAIEGISNLRQLAGRTEYEIRQLHGIGANALLTLKNALAEKNLSFKEHQAAMVNAMTVDKYIASFPEATQEKLRQLRSFIKKEAPATMESISYGIAAYKMNSSPIVYFAGFKNHIGLYPAPVNNPAFIAELAAYKTGKGSVQFPLDKPLPLGLVKKIIAFRLQENELNVKMKKVNRYSGKKSLL